MDFPGGPLVKTLPSNVVCVVLISGGGTKIPHALWPKTPKYKTETNLVTNSIRTIKMVHIKKYIYIYIIESLCYTPVPDTVLYINCISIKIIKNVLQYMY